MHPYTKLPIVLLALAGALLLGQSIHMQAKAKLAQVLIARSWQANLDSGKATKPWPWADISPVAKLSVPRLGVRQYVMQNTSGEALAFGAGLLPQSAAPGSGGHSIIAGHRDSHFAFLQRLQSGDEIRIENQHGRQQRYRVRQTRIADSSREPLYFDLADAKLTLITCYPFDAVAPGGPLRYVVEADAVI